MKNILGAFLLFLTLSCNSQTKDSSTSLAQIIEKQKVDVNKISILIDKSDYKLYVQAEGKTLKEYPVVFGSNPVDDKLMEGDRRTPEGKFKIITKYPHKHWSKFIWLNYPTKESWEKYKKAKKEGKIPSNATVGGQVGIHGVPEGADYAIDKRQNWTFGCISLKNKDVNEIYPYINKNTVIEIRK